jgi:hypothetical protein
VRKKKEGERSNKGARKRMKGGAKEEELRRKKEDKGTRKGVGTRSPSSSSLGRFCMSISVCFMNSCRSKHM